MRFIDLYSFQSDPSKKLGWVDLWSYWPLPFELENLFSIFVKPNRSDLIHWVDKGKSIDHNHYIENCLKPVVKDIWKQRKSSGTNGIKLIHDNTRSHTHSDVINNLTQEGINIIPHPPYSPDFTVCN